MRRASGLSRMRIKEIEPHGFCAGVSAAIDKAMSLSGVTYALHHLVHSEIVVKELEERGLRFVDSESDIPDFSNVIISAHGASPALVERLEKRSITVIDATCPYVARVHRQAASFAREGMYVVIAGDASHAEVLGIKGEVECVPGARFSVVSSVDEAERLESDCKELGVVSQTTVDSSLVDGIVAALSKRFKVVAQSTICSATRERQRAVLDFSGDALLVLGSGNSSNTRRLCSISTCSRVFRAADMEELRKIDFSGIGLLGVTSGASTPESFFRQAIAYLGGLE